jgi:general nucleoside transport system permease protein
MDFATVLQILDSTVRLATPLLLCCLAGLFSERAGIFDIGLEGKMLAAAMMSGAIAAVTGNVWLGLLAGVAASMALAGIHGLASITFRGNQLISGVAINFLASGMTVLLAQNWFRQGGRTPPLSPEEGSRFAEIALPFAGSLRGVPVLGPVYADLISGHSILVYFAFLAVPGTWWLLFRTRFGLRLRAVGENPAAVDTAGVSVVGLRFAAVGICGVLCGVAGAYLATSLSAGFGKEMTAGKGFIALAALIFAKWRPWPAMWACLLFGLLEAISIRYQNIPLNGVWGWLALGLFAGAVFGLFYSLLRAVSLAPLLSALVATAIGVVAFGLVWQASTGGGVSAPALVLPVQFTQALPYILTIVILAGFVGKAIPPRAGGEPYVKER